MRHGIWVLLTLLLASNAQADNMLEALSQHCDGGITRQELPGVPGIAHYSALVQMGPGEHDRVRLHRVVRENSPWVPKASPKGVMLRHGDSLNFVVSWLWPGPNGDYASSFAVYLAQKGFDVWGLDARWSVVPEGAIDPADPTSDDFMATWDLELDAEDAHDALGIARVIRALTGSGTSKMKYLGWSRGAQTGYVLAQQEALMPARQRHMNGVAFLDVPFKAAPDQPELAAALCAFSDQIEAAMAAGSYADTTGLTIRLVGNLAVSDPNGPSPLVPGFSNMQTAMALGGATWRFFRTAPLPDGVAYVPWYHLVGAEFSETGVPLDLLFTDETVFANTAANVSPYEAWGTMLQGDRVVCADTPLDDHLAAVTIPAFNVGANGGFGPVDDYGFNLLGSTDKTNIDITITGDVFNDFGHDDVVRSPLAKALWWDAFAAWLTAH